VTILPNTVKVAAKFSGGLFGGFILIAAIKQTKYQVFKRAIRFPSPAPTPVSLTAGSSPPRARVKTECERYTEKRTACHGNDPEKRQICMAICETTTGNQILDPYSITFAPRDGVSFVFWQGARRAPIVSVCARASLCLIIVTDEQRRQRAKVVRPCGVTFRKPLSFVACLHVAPATRLRCTPRQRISENDHAKQMGSNKGLAMLRTRKRSGRVLDAKLGTIPKPNDPSASLLRQDRRAFGVYHPALCAVRPEMDGWGKVLGLVKCACFDEDHALLLGFGRLREHG
jgi:hypothetical protein